MEIVNIEQEGYKLKVHGTSCVGCQRHGKDIMIALPTPSDNSMEGVEFIDIFLTTDQAERLVAGLMWRIDDNTNKEQ